MLVRFDSNVAGEMLMFADVARRLLQAAGKECTARGVILAEQVPEIVARLRQAVAADRGSAPADEGDDDEAPQRVSLGQRAQPFIELLELTARKKDGFVLWEAPRDFDK
ncbi:DUF1840 domain-containing protein [Azospira restricta]|uniref:DUF1840 domain-containing protein n=1 Tax=Azospira restricta TaxID=404405 RepID=A0A974SQ44_9RHOO|nr:DUF1840 domain-containing protein [Azospira restricta]QRJ64407.1 DUF1840 domain-containing protein [Azospira restricta]